MAASAHVFLMCPPEYFNVAYIINPWMHGNLKRIDNAVAKQQWRALYARRETEYWPTFLGLLGEGNRTWAHKAAALVVFISRRNFEYNGEPSITHSYDCGAAWQNFALQGFKQGLVVHGMQGFDYDRARIELRIPDDFQIEAMAAVGKPGPKETLPEKLQKAESPNDRRKIGASVCEGPFGL